MKCCIARHDHMRHKLTMASFLSVSMYICLSFSERICIIHTSQLLWPEYSVFLLNYYTKITLHCLWAEPLIFVCFLSAGFVKTELYSLTYRSAGQVLSVRWPAVL